MKRLLRIGGVERDVGEELAFHFAESVDELVRQGRSRQEAEAEVRRRFGDVAYYRRELMELNRSMERRMRWSDRLEGAGGAMVQAVRGLARTPGMTLGIVLVFALGVGANATMLEIVDRLLLRAPDHVVAPDEVNRVVVDRPMDAFMESRGERMQSEYMTYPDYLDLRAASSLAAVAGYAPRQLTLGRGEGAHRVKGVLAAGDYFDLIGVRPRLGRFFTSEEARIGGAHVAVLGYGYWQSQYGGAPDVLGKTLEMGEARYTIIGVAPEGLTTVDLAPAQVWLPLEVAQLELNGDGWVESRNWWWMRALVRRADDASIARVEAELTALHLAARTEAIARDDYAADTKLRAYPLPPAEAPGAGAESRVARWLVGVALVVLLIACINVTNLLFARALRRQREIGIQLALGVTRGRLIGRIVLEGVLLGVLGGAAALAVAYWGGGALRRVLLPDVAWDELGLGGRVVALTAALALLAGALSALVPALQAARRNVGDVLRTSSGGITRSALRVRTVLSFAQAALSVLLLIGAGLFVRSVGNVRALDHGYEPDGLLYANIILPRGSVPDVEQEVNNRSTLERVRRLPGVTHAAFTSAMPFWSYTAFDIDVEGVDSLATPPTGGPYVQVVTADYFATMGMALLRGRGFDGTTAAAVVNESMARGIAPYGEPLGRCLYVSRDDEAKPPCIPIVGVVENTTFQELQGDPAMQYYLHYPPGSEQAARYSRGATLMLRVRGDAGPIVAGARRQILAVDPRYHYIDIAPFQDRLDPLARSWRLGATLFSVFGLLALLVAGVGLYSVLAFDVAQRTRELGLRTALGAPVGRLLAMIVGRGVRITALGIATGLALAALLAPRVEGLLFGVAAWDLVTYVAVAVVLMVVALVASWGPAWRASRVDPNVALKAE